MSIITNLKTEDNYISFDLNNNTENPIKIGLANSLRRVIISSIETYCIDRKSIIFFESYDDATILNDEFLMDRLVLIPIISDLEDIDYDNIVISCKKENMEEKKNPTENQQNQIQFPPPPQSTMIVKEPGFQGGYQQGGYQQGQQNQREQNFGPPEPMPANEM